VTQLPATPICDSFGNKARAVDMIKEIKVKTTVHAPWFDSALKAVAIPM